MAEKKLDDLPPNYSNLGFDGEPCPGPSAPTNSDETKFQKNEFIDPPPAPTAPSPEAQQNLGPPPMFYDPPSLVFEDIYEACLQYAKKHCCYGTRFVNQMKLADIINKGVFYYTLESFGEKRESAIDEKPYKGGAVDGPENGPPPEPWSMTVLPPDMFKNCRVKIPIPHTERVWTCTKCGGTGQNPCSSCNGMGYSICFSCSGSGRDRDFRSCSSCFGSGRRTCIWCVGTGRTSCRKCDGYGKVKSWRVLLATWENHTSDYFSDAGNMPNNLIRKAKGIELFRQKEKQLLPITNAPDASVNSASARIIQRHKTAFPNELIIRQRQILRAVPLTRVTYNWRDKDGEFYVYGTDRKVFFEDYPQPCCCCTCC